MSKNADPSNTDEKRLNSPLSQDEIRSYYKRVQPALEPLGELRNYQTGLNYDKTGWYRTRDNSNIDEIKAGFDKKCQMLTIDRNLDYAIDHVSRSLYVLTSYKTRKSMRRWTPVDFDGGNSRYPPGQSGTPDTSDLRAVSVWGDVDLADDLKPKRGNLSEETRKTAEEALQAYADEFAKLYGGHEAIYMLDSVGGAYILGAPSATLPITDLFDDDEQALGWVLDELIDRSNEWLRDAEQRVNERIPGAERVINPDWANNGNRQYKAPLSLHADHDAVVTPLDPTSVTYSMTPIEDVDDALISEAKSWSEALTSPDYTDRVAHLVEVLWEDEMEDGESWKETLKSWVEEKREKEQRRKERWQKREERREELADSLEGAQLTTDRNLVWDAVDCIDVRDVAEEIADIWHGEKSPPRFGPPWHKEHNSGQSSFADREKFHDHQENFNGDAATLIALSEGISADDDLTGGEFGQALDVLREHGYPIPVWVPEAGAERADGSEYDHTPVWALRKAAVALGVCSADEFVEKQSSVGDGTYLGFPDNETRKEVLQALDEEGIDHGWDLEPQGGTTKQFPIEACEPPVRQANEFDRERRWEAFQEERYEEFLESNSVTIFADPPGTGKTTNAAIAAAQRDRPFTLLFKMHEKAREFIKDSQTPDDVFHLKGAEQKRYDTCMDADHREDAECPEHGRTVNCPSMCPIYDLPNDAPRREEYEAVQQELGPVEAHVLLEPHDGDDCQYMKQFDGLEYEDRIVGVHEYLTLATVANDDQDVIVDEKPRALINDRELTPNQLLKIASMLDDLDDHSVNNKTPAVRTLESIADFATELAEAVSTGSSLDEVVPPTVWHDCYDGYNDVAGNYREFQSPEDEDGERWQYGEAYAKAKIKFNSVLRDRIEDREWDGVPLAFDALIAAAIEAGHPQEPLLKAIALPPFLKSCPWCRERLETNANGDRVCENCEWNEIEDWIMTRDAECARALCEVTNDALYYCSLPLCSDLPSSPLILDATATPERIGALFGDSDPLVTGDEPLSGNMVVTQVTDGQYHAGTIRQSDSLQKKIQRVIDEAGRHFERPLFIMQKEFERTFTFPDNAETLHYHAARGLNRNDCDAVFCVGAPHPPVDELETEATLLAQQNDALRVGGAEYSTRRKEGQIAANEPIYRKLHFVDENGRGRAVPTKHYSGLVGALFHEAREKELVQAVHRVRPLLADEKKHVYLLTNVPTSLPVDHLVELEDLVSPVRDRFPLPERATRLVEQLGGVCDGRAPESKAALFNEEDGELTFFRADLEDFAHECDIDVSSRTIANWVDDLKDLGLVVEGEYVPRKGNRLRLEKSTLKDALIVMSVNASFKVDEQALSAPSDFPSTRDGWKTLAQDLTEDPPEAKSKARSVAD